jgi:hypothetical protein
MQRRSLPGANAGASRRREHFLQIDEGIARDIRHAAARLALGECPASAPLGPSDAPFRGNVFPPKDCSEPVGDLKRVVRQENGPAFAPELGLSVEQTEP